MLKKTTYKKTKGFRLLLMTSVVIVGITISGCSNKGNTPDIEDTYVTPVGDQNALLTPTPTPVAMTPAPGVTITPAAEATLTPNEPTPIQTILPEAEAKMLVLAQLDVSKYNVELSDDHLAIDGEYYYVYVVLEGTEFLEPAIIVNQRNGSLYSYDSDGNVTPFYKFPVDKVEPIDDNSDSITEQDALDLLKGLSAEKLGLAKSLEKYVIVADSWTTIVKGKSSYCFNVFSDKSQSQLVALFYVSADGEEIYRFDDVNGEYIKVN